MILEDILDYKLLKNGELIGEYHSLHEIYSVVKKEFRGRKEFVFINNKASWRSKPVSEKQRHLLHKMGKDCPQTCGEASDLLNIIFNRRKK